MITRITYFFMGGLCWVALGQVSACAQDDPLPLEGAVAMARKHHPQLRAARMDIAIAEARTLNIGRLPDPELEMSAQRSTNRGDDREEIVFIGLSQRFPVTDRLRRAEEVRRIDVELASMEVAEAERRLAGEVRQQFIHVLAAEQHVVILREFEDQLTSYAALAAQRLEQAQGSELDIASARTEAMLATNARTTAEAQLREEKARLRPLLGWPPELPVVLAGTLESVIGQLRQAIPAVTVTPSQKHRPDVAVAALRAQRAEAEGRLARSERWEDWEISVGYQNERSIDEPVGSERDHFFGIGLRIPLPLRKHSTRRIAEATAREAKAQILTEALHQQAIAELAAELEAVAKAATATETIRTSILPLLQNRERMTRRAYEQGLIDFTPVAQLQQQRLRIRQALLDHQRDHALALGRLRTAVASYEISEAHRTAK